MLNMKKMVWSTAVVLAFGPGSAHAFHQFVTTTGNNFTIVNAVNTLTGGTNDVTFTWDRTFRTAVATDGLSNATLSSPTAFSGGQWTVHHMNVYSPGTYTFNTGCASGGVSSTTYDPSCGAGNSYHLTVGADQIGAHLLWNWRGYSDIDVVLLWDKNKSWAETGTTSAFCGGTGAGCQNPVVNGYGGINRVWDAVSIDTPASTISAGSPADEINTFSGTQMIDGPLVKQSFNFNVNGFAEVPVPAAVWLLGSGLLGLVGVARRKKAA